MPTALEKWHEYFVLEVEPTAVDVDVTDDDLIVHY
jgi:hypothetical protein